jgi:DNA repair protein RadC
MKQYPLPGVDVKTKKDPTESKALERRITEMTSPYLPDLLTALIGQEEKARTFWESLNQSQKRLSNITPAELTFYGLTPSQALRVIAALKLGTVLLSGDDEKVQVHEPRTAAELLLHQLSNLDHEELWVILLDARNKVVHKQQVYVGSLNTAQVRIGEIFKIPVAIKAAAIIIIHNHPSGDTSPSPDDVAITRAIVQAGKLLDVNVLDHIIIAGGRFVSMKERGVGFS